MVIIQLTKGLSAIIDDVDAEKVKNFSWIAHKGKHTWYARAWVRVGRAGIKHGIVRGGKFIYLHRLIMGFPDGKQVDHKDRDGLNCRRENLREATQNQNMQNMRMRTSNKSGFRGVCFKKGNITRPWIAQIRNGKTNVCIGRFSTAKEAAVAYNAASLKIHGEFGYRNLIPD